MKRYFILIAILILGIITACDSGEIDDIESKEAKAKTVENGRKDDGKDAAEEVPDDIWTYYNDATWEEDFNGLHTEIQKVVVTEKAPTIDDENAEMSAVGVKFLVENTTDDNIFTTYPDQATLVTSTGEQVSADMFLSDHIGGEIHEGVIKEGDVIFYLERGEAESIEWIKLEWETYDEGLSDAGDYDNYAKTHSVKLDIK